MAWDLDKFQRTTKINDEEDEHVKKEKNIQNSNEPLHLDLADEAYSRRYPDIFVRSGCWEKGEKRERN